MDTNSLLKCYTEALKKKYEPCDDMSVFMKKILQSENMYTYLSSADRVENQCILRRVGRFIIDSINIDQENPYGQGSVTNDVDIKKTENALHLFIYAILFESEEKAQTRLSDCDDPIGAALIASSLLKTISKLANRDAELDLATNVLKNAREYEQKACDMLSTYFHRNRTGAYTFLIHKFHEPFSSINALELANANHLKNFMAHTCCQTKLNAVWRGKMATYTPWWQIVIALFLPIFVKTIKFTPEKSQDAGDSFGTFDDLYHLYTAPISVFATNTISFLIFVGLCSYFVLVELEVRVTLLEYVIWGWALTLLFEEFRQLISSDGSIARKLRYWFASYWNQYDLAMFIVGVAAIIVRLTVNGDDEFDSVRYLYSITVAMFYVRSLQSFLVEENLGPKIIMLGKMIIDLIVFVRVFLIFVLSFGIMYTANLFPNSRLSLQLLKRIFYVPYWQIYGENFLEFLEGDDNGCTRNESVWRDTGDMRCPESKVLVPVLGGLYMFLTNILLINLLIAMFSYTFQTIQDQSEKIWRFYLYSIVREYYERPVIPHPFIILAHVVRIICHLRCCNAKQSDNEFTHTKLLESMKYLVENGDLKERGNLRSALVTRIKRDPPLAQAREHLKQPVRESDISLCERNSSIVDSEG